MRRRLNTIAVSSAKKRVLKEKIDELELNLIEAELNRLKPDKARGIGERRPVGSPHAGP
jgi:hypothetical protein